MEAIFCSFFGSTFSLCFARSDALCSISRIPVEHCTFVRMEKASAEIISFFHEKLTQITQGSSFE
jgi:hypothetical protein